MNSTAPYVNTTQVSIYTNKTPEILRLAIVAVALICFCFFTFLMTVLLKVYFTSPHVKENARYILFVHMLINDTLYLVAGFFLLVSFAYLLYIPVPICYIILTLAACTFRITPYNLAAMALERYIAICYPLRHAELFTGQTANAAIVAMWTLGLIPNVADLITLASSVDKSFFSLSVLCRKETLTRTLLQNTIRSIALILTLSLVGLIILYTYIKVMLVARKIGSGTSSAFKAGKTVMLHACQLLLSMMSLLSMLTEAYLIDYIVILSTINFVLFMCLPRFLSPLIYGVRDEVFSKYLKKLCSAKR
ncbi:odorant receptor 131-2-like [Rhinophrynus dorsalis]